MKCKVLLIEIISYKKDYQLLVHVSAYQHAMHITILGMHFSDLSKSKLVKKSSLKV
jgi:hypothetical protein